MRYLNRFNESSLTREDVEALVRDYLSYLIDQRYDVEVVHKTIFSCRFDINITVNSSPPGNGFGSMDWDSIKDEVLPFIEILERGGDVVLDKVVMYNFDNRNDSATNQNHRKNISFVSSIIKGSDKFMYELLNTTVKTIGCLSIEIRQNKKRDT